MQWRFERVPSGFSAYEHGVMLCTGVCVCFVQQGYHELYELYHEH